MKSFLLFLSTVSLLVFCPSSVFAGEIDWQKNLKEGYQQLTMGNTEKAVDIFSKKVKKYPSSAAESTSCLLSGAPVLKGSPDCKEKS